jgi:hypothetical protein
MSKLDAKSLPEAEFYYLRDGRDSSTFLACEHQIGHPLDEDDQWSGDEATNESEQIHRRLALRLAEIVPGVSESDTRLAFDRLYPNGQHPFTPDMVHKESFFKTRRPARLEHIEFIRCPHPAWVRMGTYYTVVSADWMKAIESVEPSVHEFFQHKLNFRDSEVVDRYIFRYRGNDFDSNMIQRISSKARSRKDEILSLIGRGTIDEIGYPITELEMNSASFAGRHLVAYGQFSLFVSRTLALKLFDLLPDGVLLLPMASADS